MCLGQVDAGWNVELAVALPSWGAWKANHETGKVSALSMGNGLGMYTNLHSWGGCSLDKARHVG